MSTVVLYASDLMADWQYAVAIAGLAHARRSGRVRGRRGVPDLVVASADGQPTRTLGGLQVVPGRSVGQIDADDVELLILPGGGGWPVGAGRWIRDGHEPTGPHAAVLALAERLLCTDRAVAGSCAATRAMAEAGFLDEVPHTSNSPAFLAETEYDGQSRYIAAPAVGSGDVITASGVAPIPFAREVLRRLELFDDPVVSGWLATFTDES